MAIYEVKHPKWGSNLANQLSASCYGYDGQGNKIEMVDGWFGKRKKEVHVGWIFDPSDDASDAERKFQHRCGLLRIVMTSGYKGSPCFVVFFEGHPASNFDSEEVVFRFSPGELRENGDKPVADVWFQGKGERLGPLRNYGTTRVVCTFADKAQLDQYLVLSSSNRRMPSAIRHEGVTYRGTGGGSYQSDHGSILPYLLVMWYLLSSEERAAFAAQNPEIQTLLPETPAEVAPGEKTEPGSETPDGPIAEGEAGQGEVPGNEPDGAVPEQGTELSESGIDMPDSGGLDSGGGMGMGD